METNMPQKHLPDLIDSQYKIFFELTEQGFCLVEQIPGPDGHLTDYRYLAVNPSFQKQIGIPNVIGQTFRGTTPEGKLPILEHYDKVVATGKPLNFEEWVPEMEVWIQAEVFPTKIPGQIAILFNNITKRKQWEKALQENEERLRTLTTLVPALLWEADTLGVSIQLNKQWCTYTGQTFEETQYGGWLDAIHPEDLTNTRKIFIKAFTSGKTIELEHRVRAANGQYRWFQVQHQPVFNEKGRVTKWFGAAVDINERKLAEEALRSSEGRLKTVLDGISEAFYALDKDFCFLFATKFALKIWDKSPEEVIGHNFLEIFPLVENSVPFTAHLKVMETKVPVRLEIISPILHRWIEVQIAPTEQGGLSVSFWDIEERKRQEANLAFLAEVSDKLIKLTDINETMNVLGERFAVHFGLSACAFVELVDNAETGIINYSWQTAAMPDLRGTYRMEEFVKPEILQNTSAGEAVIICDVFADPRIDSEHYAALNIGSFVSMPLMRSGEWRFLLVVYKSEPYNWRDTEIELLRELTDRIWVRLEKARADEALKATSDDLEYQVRKFDVTLSTIEDNVFSFDREGRVIFANKHLLDLWGLQPGEEEGRSLEELGYPPELITILHGYINRVFTNGKTIRDEAPYTSPTGTTGYYDYIMTPVFKDNGEVDHVIGSARDISERVKAANVLQESEERQQYLLKLSDALRPLIDPVDIQETAVKTLGEHLQVNRAFYGEVLDDGNTLVIGPGYTKDVSQIEGKIKFTDFDSDLPELYKAGQTVILNNVDNDVSNSQETKASLKAIEIKAAIGIPLLKDGKLRAILSLHQSTAREWTDTEIALVEETAERTWAAVERAKAETALRDSEMRRKVAMDAFEIGMFVWYPLEDRAEPDERLLQLYGLNAGDQITKSMVLGKLIHPEDRDYYSRQINRAIDPRNGGNLYAEIRIIYPDGSIHWLMITGQTIFEGKPLKPARMYGLAWDITAKKEVEEALKLSEGKYLEKLEQRVINRTAELQESRDRLQSIFDTTLIQMSILEAIRDKKGRIIDFEIKSVNKELEHVTARKDLVGKRYLQEYPGVKQVGLFDLIVKTIETGTPQQKEYFYTYEGFKQWFSCMFVKISDGVVATNTDITTRKQAEETIKKMEAEQQRQIFQTSLSTLEEERHRISESLHNGLGQILYGVKLSLSNLRKEIAEDDFSEARNYTEKLLTDAIKENRRISHELMPLILEEFGLKLAVEDICNQFTDGTRFSCSIKGAKIRLEKYLELAVYRTVQELMINVVKHAEATEASVQIDIKPDQVIMNVTDNGEGINRNEGKQDGIGLKSIRSKIKLLNGVVRIRSKKGKGTEVEVIIPLAETQE